ncbi:MAG TPA: polynucleotide adenylyltransferase PcnB [Candidatus Binataceae bacterium]|nr:polynucleotide adenylyltransferase PcnB [Candidatus Binataceae bacterium]
MEPRILDRADHPISRRDIDPNVLKVLYRLIGAGHIAYLVGGGVRDLMLSRQPKDFDVGTSAHPQQVRDLFRNSRLIGRRFRLVHVFFGSQNIEVATFRRPSEDLADAADPLIRHDNTFGTPEEDAFRRDFTVNALFYDPQTFRVIDFSGGVEDLEARLIRSIGEPELRMREDPVRMMRAVRFAAKLGFELEPATRAAIERHCGDLTKASVPRLVEETFRTIGQPQAASALAMMEELGLLEPLLPFLSEHLKSTAFDDREAPTLTNLAALGRAFSGGLGPDRSTILAAMFLDLSRAQADAAEDARLDLLGVLRARGFARGDTENMRLLLDAFALMVTPNRRTRRLLRRPYFHEARRLFEICAPTYGIDDAPLRRFIADPDSILQPQQAAPEGATAGGRRKRRRRRRSRHRGTGEARLMLESHGVAPQAEANGGASSNGASAHHASADSSETASRDPDHHD